MLIRILGAEKDALSEKNTHPFTDASWADAYVGYAYKNNLVKGMSDTEFGTALPMTKGQFATLLMRAIGYSDDVGGQFTYDGAYEFALLVHIGLLSHFCVSISINCKPFAT